MCDSGDLHLITDLGITEGGGDDVFEWPHAGLVILGYCNLITFCLPPRKSKARVSIA